ncbi:alpha/beta hydrolase [Roseobacter sp. YSTF-M11]|uniref:Alpha/beta hydrolase n=1 Tax=Roseobacter insulae TaxID=2859783 RepID=A0A9X1FUY2_9RHOB|nr:alpha/beta hydrolase [Roseobacter insulae]MBW4708201.1 alpha/beta hydrolase [Roseobacter insulae]
MNVWALDETYKTRAGAVAAGRCGKGPALVLAHGWPWSSFAWHRLIPALSRQFHVHWYDMPGYGQSEMRENQRTSLDVQGEVFAEMLKHWGLSRPVVLAHDFGGATTLRAHLLHGCAFDRCLLMNVVAMRPWGSGFFDHVGKHAEVFQGVPPHIHAAIVNAYVRGALVNQLPLDDLHRLTAPWLTEDGALSFYRQFAQADEKYTAEIEPLFGHIRCPTHILWGEDDPWIPLERGRALSALIPKASFDTIPGVGHLPQLEAPASVLAKIRAMIPFR